MGDGRIKGFLFSLQITARPHILRATPRNRASPPHPTGDALFLGADGVGVDGGGGELGVTQPFLCQVDEDAGGDGGWTTARAKSDCPCGLAELALRTR